MDVKCVEWAHEFTNSDLGRIIFSEDHFSINPISLWDFNVHVYINTRSWEHLPGA